MYTYKTMLLPNDKQETKIKKFLNKCIEVNNVTFTVLDIFFKKHNSLPTLQEMIDYFNNLKIRLDKKQEDKVKDLSKNEIFRKNLDVYFYSLPQETINQAIKDTYNSFIRYIRKISKYPTLKSFNSLRKSYYVSPNQIEFSDRKVKLQNLANNDKENRQVLNWVKLSEKNRVPTTCRYYNPRVVLENDRLFIIVSVQDDYRPLKKKMHLQTSDDTIGIDLNIKTINLSNGKVYKTCNKEKRLLKLSKRLKRNLRMNARKYENAKSSNRPLYECKNFKKNKKEIRKCYFSITNIRNNHNELIVDDILKSPPKTIVIESLDIKHMLKDKRISSSLHISNFKKFLNTLKNKIKYTDIRLVEASRFYQSSKKCSSCGFIKRNLLLRDRVYVCPKCGLVIDRDLNAALNLKKYAY